MTLDVATLVAFMLVLARSASWITSAPLFSTPGMGRLGRWPLAVSLALFLAPLEAHRASALPADIGSFVVVLVGQILVGLLLGWATGLLMHAFEIAGAFIDLNSGFGLSALFDPLTSNNSAVFARFMNLLFITLLVATNAHLVLIGGFVRSFDAVPAGLFPTFGDNAASAIVGGMGQLLVAALQVGAPVIGVLFLTEVVLAVAAKFAPQANVFLVGLPLKVLIGLLATGTLLIYLPAHLPGLIDASLRLGARTLT